MKWSTLLRRCAGCLTVQETAVLGRGKGRLAITGTTIPYHNDETVSQALLDDGAPSFNNLNILSAKSSTPSASPLASSSNSGSRGNRLTPSEPEFAPIPIPESVFLIYQDTEGAGPAQTRDATATAFVLSVPVRDRDTVTRFLVTARHVVDPAWAHCAEHNPSSIQIRFNRRNGGVGYEVIRLGVGSHSRYFTPSDAAADIAIILLDKNLIPNLESYKFIDTPFHLLPSKSELQDIALGQQSAGSDVPDRKLVTASLRDQTHASLGAFPLSDAGILSDIITQPVNIQCDGPASSPAMRPLHLWFMDASIPHGFSGAPVYTSMVRGGQAGQTPVLLGIQSITWPDRGVAGITPATVLGDLIQRVLEERHEKGDFYRGAIP